MENEIIQMDGSFSRTHLGFLLVFKKNFLSICFFLLSFLPNHCCACFIIFSYFFLVFFVGYHIENNLMYKVGKPVEGNSGCGTGYRVWKKEKSKNGTKRTSK